MSSRVRALLCIGVALVAMLTACRSRPDRTTLVVDVGRLPAGKSAAELIVPEHGAYAGAYIDFGEREDTVTLESIESFDAMVGKKQAIVAFSSDWGNQTFPEEQLHIISYYGAIPLVYWSPWDRPVKDSQDETSQSRFNLDSILSGTWDRYIDSWANAAKSWDRPMFVSFGLEMNGNWFPWCGVFDGGKQTSPKLCATCFAGPEKFKTAYRYVVDRVRAAGAKNIIWVWHANNTSDPDEPWNDMKNYYPGPQYVDWLGMSAYGQQYPNQEWVQTDLSLKRPYDELSAVDPTKPIMLAEWGIGEFPKRGDKAQYILESFTRFKNELTRVKAIVYWHERWQNSDLQYSNLRVNSSPRALEAYREGVANGYWLARPQFR